MRLEDEGPAVGVHHGVALPAIDFLAGIIASRTTSLRGLDALAVDHRRRRARLPPDPLTVAHEQIVVDRLEHAAFTQTYEPTIDGSSRRETIRHHAPWAARAQHIEDRVHDLTHRPAPRPARLARSR